MITAVDTSVLLDVFLEQPKFAEASAAALQQADAAGSVVICDIVYAELASRFLRQETLDGALARLDIRVESFGRDINFEAGRAFRAYREKGGPRTRILSDFLIGAHAQERAAQLLTRDRGFYRAYFRRLKIFDPTARSKT
jgi:predicted nucleic acid-binding protein